MEQNRQYSTPYQQGEDQQEEIQLLIKKYLRYWRWFVLGVVVCMSLAFIYNRYAKVVYSTEGSIKILKDQESGMDLSGLEGGGALFGIKEVNLENEIEIIKSRRLLDSIVSKLELTTFFQKVGKLTNAEIWGTQKPFLVHWHVIDTAQTKDFPVFRLNYKSETEFEISLEEGELKEEVYSVNSTFNTLIKMGGYEFVVLPNPAFRRGLEEEHTTFSY